MLIKIVIIALVIYFIVKTRAKIRLPHPGLQATVDVLQMATLKDEHVIGMAKEFIRYSDSKNIVAPADDRHALRLHNLTDKFVAINGVDLDFKVYKGAVINAFAAADGSVRVYSGLMDVMTDEELMAIIGHEMGHIRNNDSIGAMRKAYMTSAARNIVGSAGGVLGQLTASHLGSIAEKYAGAKFSQAQEFEADDFSTGFLGRNGYDPLSMADALDKIQKISSKGGQEASDIARMFSTHPDTALRATRIRNKISNTNS